MFFNSPAKASINRLKKVLVCDKDELSPVVTNIIKGDVIQLLQNYMTINKDSVSINFNISSSGEYNFCITGIATCPKNIGIYDKSQY